jgi:hypothetical protein
MLVAAKRSFNAAALTVLALVPLVGLRLWPAPNGPVAVVTNPWSPSPAVAAIAGAEGRIVRAGRWPWIAVADSDDPGFRARLPQAGAVLILSPVLLGACLRPDQAVAKP